MGHMWNSRSKRILAIGAAMLLMITVLLSVFFLAVESGHDCEGEACPICVCMEQCEHILEEAYHGTAGCIAVVSPVVILLWISFFSDDVCIHCTPVSQKVRLNH